MKQRLLAKREAILSRIPAHESAFGFKALYFSVGNVGELTCLFQELKPLDTSTTLDMREMHLATEASWQKLILRLYNQWYRLYEPVKDIYATLPILWDQTCRMRSRGR